MAQSALVSYKMNYTKISDWWNDVAEIGCIITQSTETTLHHIHGGSVMSELGLIHGIARKQSDWLVIPLHFQLHTGQYGVDGFMGVITWETKYGRQIDLMDEVCRQLDFNAWKMAGVDRDPWDN